MAQAITKKLSQRAMEAPPSVDLDEDGVFADRTLTEQYITGIYAEGMPLGFSMGSSGIDRKLSPPYHVPAHNTPCELSIKEIISLQAGRPKEVPSDIYPVKLSVRWLYFASPFRVPIQIVPNESL